MALPGAKRRRDEAGEGEPSLSSSSCSSSSALAPPPPKRDADRAAALRSSFDAPFLTEAIFKENYKFVLDVTTDNFPAAINGIVSQYLGPYDRSLALVYRCHGDDQEKVVIKPSIDGKSSTWSHIEVGRSPCIPRINSCMPFDKKYFRVTSGGSAKYEGNHIAIEQSRERNGRLPWPTPSPRRPYSDSEQFCLYEFGDFLYASGGCASELRRLDMKDPRSWEPGPRVPIQLAATTMDCHGRPYSITRGGTIYRMEQGDSGHRWDRICDGGIVPGNITCAAVFAGNMFVFTQSSLCPCVAPIKDEYGLVTWTRRTLPSVGHEGFLDHRVPAACVRNDHLHIVVLLGDSQTILVASFDASLTSASILYKANLRNHVTSLGALSNTRVQHTDGEASRIPQKMVRVFTGSIARDVSRHKDFSRVPEGMHKFVLDWNDIDTMNHWVPGIPVKDEHNPDMGPLGKVTDSWIEDTTIGTRNWRVKFEVDDSTDVGKCFCSNLIDTGDQKGLSLSHFPSYHKPYELSVVQCPARAGCFIDGGFMPVPVQASLPSLHSKAQEYKAAIERAISTLASRPPPPPLPSGELVVASVPIGSALATAVTAMSSIPVSLSSSPPAAPLPPVSVIAAAPSLVAAAAPSKAAAVESAISPSQPTPISAGVRGDGSIESAGVQMFNQLAHFGHTLLGHAGAGSSSVGTSSSAAPVGRGASAAGGGGGDAPGIAPVERPASGHDRGSSKSAMPRDKHGKFLPRGRKRVPQQDGKEEHKDPEDDDLLYDESGTEEDANGTGPSAMDEGEDGSTGGQTYAGEDDREPPYGGGIAGVATDDEESAGMAREDEGEEEEHGEEYGYEEEESISQPPPPPPSRRGRGAPQRQPHRRPKQQPEAPRGRYDSAPRLNKQAAHATKTGARTTGRAGAAAGQTAAARTTSATSSNGQGAVDRLIKTAADALERNAKAGLVDYDSTMARVHQLRGGGEKSRAAPVPPAGGRAAVSASAPRGGDDFGNMSRDQLLEFVRRQGASDRLHSGIRVRPRPAPVAASVPSPRIVSGHGSGGSGGGGGSRAGTGMVAGDMPRECRTPQATTISGWVIGGQIFHDVPPAVDLVAASHPGSSSESPSNAPTLASFDSSGQYVTGYYTPLPRQAPFVIEASMPMPDTKTGDSGSGSHYRGMSDHGRGLVSASADGYGPSPDEQLRRFASGSKDYILQFDPLPGSKSQRSSVIFAQSPTGIRGVTYLPPLSELPACVTPGLYKNLAKFFPLTEAAMAASEHSRSGSGSSSDDAPSGMTPRARADDMRDFRGDKFRGVKRTGAVY